MTPTEFQQLVKAYGLQDLQATTMRELMFKDNKSINLINAILKLQQASGKISGMANQEVIYAEYISNAELRKECNTILVAIALIIESRGMKLGDVMDDITKHTPTTEIVISEKPKK